MEFRDNRITRVFGYHGICLGVSNDVGCVNVNAGNEEGNKKKDIVDSKPNGFFHVELFHPYF
jgi:hypothetical protein